MPRRKGTKLTGQEKPYKVQVVQMRSLHQKWLIKSAILFEWTESKSAWDCWDRIHLNWARGQYFAYTFVYKIASWKMGATKAHNRPKMHSCDYFGVKIWPILTAIRKCFCVDLWRWMKHGSNTIFRNHMKGQNSGLNLVKVHQSVQKRNNWLEKLWLVFFVMHME